MNESPRPPWVTEILQPASIPELADCVREYKSGAIFPIGAGSWLDLGYRPFRTGVGVSTLGLNRVVDYPHEELTITVEAGILISDLQRILAEKRQMLPFDCPHPHRATLGGLLATNTSGPRRLAYGTARDSVLGLDVIDASGQRIHGGGRVVKNVAGYDLPKMHIGALGTLGVIVEATIKVRPIPEAIAAVKYLVPTDFPKEQFETLRHSALRPAAAEATNADPENQPTELVLFFEGSQEAVARQMEIATALASSLDADHPKSIHGVDAANNLQQATDAMAHESADMCAKLVVAPTTVPYAWRHMAAHATPCRLTAHALSGILRVNWDTKTQGDKPWFAIDRYFLSDRRGRYSMPRCPDERKRDLGHWGRLGPEWDWMRRLRDTLDPSHVLNPGRFVVE